MTEVHIATPFNGDEIEAMRVRAASKYAGPVGDLDLPNALRVMREVAEELRYEAGRWLATIDAQAKEIADLRQNTGRWNMSIEHDRRTVDVLSVNQEIARDALEQGGEK